MASEKTKALMKKRADLKPKKIFIHSNKGDEPINFGSKEFKRTHPYKHTKGTVAQAFKRESWAKWLKSNGKRWEKL